MKATSNFTPFIVFGPSKSGTTWVQKILDSHPESSCKFQKPIFPLDDQEVYVKEKMIFYKDNNPFKGVLADLDYENYMTELSIQKQVFASLKKVWAQYKESPKEGLIVDYWKTLALKVLDADKEVKAAGTKAYSNLKTFMEVFPEGKVISIVRDPRDVVVSKRFHTLRRGAYYLGDEKSPLLTLINWFSPMRRVFKKVLQVFFSNSYESFFNVYRKDGSLKVAGSALKKFAIEWNSIAGYLYAMERSYPDNMIIIRYEDLKKSPHLELKKMFSLLEIDDSADAIENCLEATRPKQKAEHNSFFRKGEPGDWERHLDRNDLLTISKYCSETANKLAYQL